MCSWGYTPIIHRHNDDVIIEYGRSFQSHSAAERLRSTRALNGIKTVGYVPLRSTIIANYFYPLKQALVGF
jgi:hypothetical protein